MPICEGADGLGCLRRPVASNVRDRDTPIVQDTCDEKEPVTVRRILFAAHHRNPMASHAFDETLDTSDERRRLGHSPIEDMTVGIVELVTVGPTPEFPSEKPISDVVLV